MNLTYFRFTFINTIKKRPVWITWLLFLLTTTVFMIVVPLVARMNPLQLWANTTMAVLQSFLGMTVALFTAVLAIHIFKDSNEEGTELIVISKPISRLSIVLTKFLVFTAFCLLVNLTCCAITAFTWFLPRLEHQFYWKLVVSMFIGNLVSFGVFGAIAILLSVPFAKAGVIIVNVMISLVFIIYQILTLFVFSTPSRSMIDHGMSSTSYIVPNRDMKTGKYTEENIVRINTNRSNREQKNPNRSINWKDTVNYINTEILKNDPTLALNLTDFASQIALSYLTVGLGDYSARQAQRMYHISRFYDYELTSPASPELLEDIDNKQTLNWIYLDADSFDIYLTETDKMTLIWPQTVGFMGIAPNNINRLRGFADKIPVGYLRDKDHLLLDSDVFFEPEQWVKYSPAFQVMYDNIFNYQHYSIPEKWENQEWNWGYNWQETTENLSHYYDLIWACFTGHSTDEKYFGPDSPMKDYTQQFFDINNANDLNERFIQFKCYCGYEIGEQQRQLFAKKGNVQEEIDCKQSVEESDIMKLIRGVWGSKTQYSDLTNWYCVANGDDSYIEPNTRTPDIQLCLYVVDYLNQKITDKAERIKVLPNTTFAQYHKINSIFGSCVAPNEEYLFVSLDKPERSATRNGKTYCYDDDWVPYFQTLLTLTDLPIAETRGHNLQWFYFKSTSNTEYWWYAVAWAIVSLGMLIGGAVVYYKHDVK